MSLYDHFRKEEHEFVDRVLEWREQVAIQYAFKRTDFLDPRQQEILKLVIGKDDEVRYQFSGGHPNTERKRAIIYPEYYEPEEKDFGLVLFEIRYPSKFVTITHRDVLGALMSLGIKREKYGDIIVDEEIVHIVVAEEIGDYLSMNLNAIGKATVSVKQQQFDRILEGKDEWVEKTGSVSSLRLDTLLSEMYNLSRQKTLPLVQNGYVKVNWKIVEQPSLELREGDHISARGFGRRKLFAIEGKTKKDKWRVSYGIQK